MSYDGLLNDTCTLRVFTVTAGTTGVPEATASTVSTGVPCTVQLNATTETEAQFREAGIRTGNLYLPYGQTVSEGYIVSAFTLSPQSGLVFSVTGPPVDDAGRGTYYRVPVQKVGGRTAGEN